MNISDRYPQSKLLQFVKEFKEDQVSDNKDLDKMIKVAIVIVSLAFIIPNLILLAIYDGFAGNFKEKVSVDIKLDPADIADKVVANIAAAAARAKKRNPQKGKQTSSPKKEKPSPTVGTTFIKNGQRYVYVQYNGKTQAVPTTTPRHPRKNKLGHPVSDLGVSEENPDENQQPKVSSKRLYTSRLEEYHKSRTNPKPNQASLQQECIRVMFTLKNTAKIAEGLVFGVIYDEAHQLPVATDLENSDQVFNPCKGNQEQYFAPLTEIEKAELKKCFDAAPPKLQQEIKDKVQKLVDARIDKLINKGTLEELEQALESRKIEFDLVQAKDHLYFTNFAPKMLERTRYIPLNKAARLKIRDRILTLKRQELQRTILSKLTHQNTPIEHIQDVLVHGLYNHKGRKIKIRKDMLNSIRVQFAEKAITSMKKHNMWVLIANAAEKGTIAFKRPQNPDKSLTLRLTPAQKSEMRDYYTQAIEKNPAIETRVFKARIKHGVRQAADSVSSALEETASSITSFFSNLVE